MLETKSYLGQVKILDNLDLCLIDDSKRETRTRCFSDSATDDPFCELLNTEELPTVACSCKI